MKRVTIEQRDKLTAVFKQSRYGVIATYSSSSEFPESAVVAVSWTDNFEIVFGSFTTTRKNVNILKNPHVSFVVGWDDSKTIQIEGTAVLVTSDERSILEDNHCKQNPLSEKYRADLRQKYFKVIPRWLRYSDFSLDPQEVWELSETEI